MESWEDGVKNMKQAYLITGTEPKQRIALGYTYLETALKEAGYQVERVSETDFHLTERKLAGEIVYAGVRGCEFIEKLEEQGLLIYHSQAPEGEGFYLAGIAGYHLTAVIGGGDTGTLYGLLELTERVKQEGKLPRDIAYGDAPVFRLRGPALGLQLTHIEPPRHTYEYPITPGRFPWFYDKQQWCDLLDQLLLQRCNVIYIWSGHPFSSLVKVPDYPEALEVTEEEFKLNQETFRWLTQEADKRGIWVVLKFYNIHIPLPFAQHHGLDLLQSQINPLVADYTHKSIVEFIKAFPHIGLMVCLGEALRGTQNKTDWFLKTIIPAVNAGIKEAGLTEVPPLILRGHDCDPNAIMKEAVHMYDNIYTMWKYNGEGLTSYLPTGKWQAVHQELSSHGQTHIMNVHILADLEPFRYGAPSFIQKCVQAGQNRLGANALHLYPLFYWDWPYAPDKAQPRLKQIDRDWLWYQTWFRYAWNPNRDYDTERTYWTRTLAEHFGCGEAEAVKILEAIEYAGECAPRILRRVGITEGNRQTMSLGMTMSEFTNVKRYRPNYELWRSVSTPGEQPDEYVQKELAGEPHYGETPIDMCEEVVYYAKTALDDMKSAADKITKHQDEYANFVTDLEAIYLMSYSYAKKIEGAVEILKYKYTMDEAYKGDLAYLENAQGLMEESLKAYRELAALTDKTYLYACSMQTRQRKIPFTDGDAFGHWTQCLVEYENEYANFVKHLDEMKQGIFPSEESEVPEGVEALVSAEFEVLSPGCEKYILEKGNSIFNDGNQIIQSIAPEIKGLTGVRVGLGPCIESGVAVKLELKEDSQVLFGYLNAKGVEWMQVPDLETNTHADDRGGLAVVYANAMKVEGCPEVNVHAFQYEKGVHEIYMGTGGYTIIGVVPKGVVLNARNAGLSGESLDKLDWLYE